MFNYGCNGSTAPEIKYYTIGVVNIGEGHEEIIENFKKGLAQLGYLENKNLTILNEKIILNEQNLQLTIEDYVKKKVDLIYTLKTPATLRAKKLVKNSDIPIIFAPVFSPVKAQVVSSLYHHGENIAGIRVRGTTGKALELFVNTVLDVQNVFVLVVPSEIVSRLTYKDLKQAAKILNIDLVKAEVSTCEQIKSLMEFAPSGIDAFWILHSQLLASCREPIYKAAEKLQIPVGASTTQQDGILLSYFFNHEDLGKQAGEMAGKILGGVNPAEMPIFTAEFFLAVNVAAGRKIGITIPDKILKQADIIIR